MSVKRIPSSASGAGRRVAIVVSRFNAAIGEVLLAGAVRGLREAGVPDADITIVTVPGALETPLALQRLAQSGDYDALVALGAVIRGETAHFEYVAGECSRGVAEVALRHALPIGFGVLTCEDLEQARARAGGPAGDKGEEAALAALEMAGILARLRG